MRKLTNLNEPSGYFRLESRTNEPPRNVDEQAIPKSLEHMIKLKQIAKNNASKNKKRKRKKSSLICVGSQQDAATLHPKARPEKVVPMFQQEPGESGQHFLHRVSKDTHAFLKETAFEEKYGVQVKRDPETGLIQGLTKNKDNIEGLRANHKNTGKKKATREGAKALTKKERRKLQLRLKRKKRQMDDGDEFGGLQDKVAFGEVAHEPPRLQFKKKEVAVGERKPENLLLSSLLEATPRKVAAASKVINRSGKRKKLPVAERRKLEMQQDKVIASYRRLKAERLADNTD